MDRLQFKEDIQIPVPWGHLSAKVWGPDNGFPMLALHGWQDNAGSFDTLAPLLPANIRLVCLDFCGYGLSSHYPPGMFLTQGDDYIYHVKLVVDYFKWEKVILIGHSMGGHVCLFFAAMFPERVHKLISLDALKLLSAPPEKFPEKMRKVLNEFERIATRMNILLIRSLRKKGQDEYEHTRDPRTTIYPFLFFKYTTEMLKEMARGITCPFLLIRGRNSIIPGASEPIDLLQEFYDIYQSASKDFRYIEVDGKHHIHLTHPDIVAPCICDFLITTGQ